MVKFTSVGYKPKLRLERRKANVLARIRWLRTTEVEERPLEAMLHWRDPVERLRTLRRQSHTLVDDNPASG